MSVDVEIYLSNIIKFFKNNPNELTSLIPKDKENEFYERIKETANNNFENGEEVSLTQQQLVKICVEINGGVYLSTKTKTEIFQKTKYGVFCLN